MQNGIVVAGYLGVDVLKEVTGFPQAHELDDIESVTLALGGLVNNCGRSLALLDPNLPVRACGRIGTDGYGDELLRQLGKYKNIDTSMLLREGQTAFSDVLSNIHTRERAFLTFMGASAEFSERHVPIDELDCKIFHVGYVLLLKSLDEPDEEFGTKMARLMKLVQERGIWTSVDVITNASGRHKDLMPPAMKYADILCINEHEAAASIGIRLRDGDDRLILENIPKALARFKELGVRRWAAIHAPEGGFGLDEHGKYHVVPGAIVPKEFIAGTVGAGDAFASGLLLGAYRDRPMDEALEYAIAAAVSSLSKGDASEGVLELGDALKLLGTFERRRF